MFGVTRRPVLILVSLGLMLSGFEQAERLVQLGPGAHPGGRTQLVPNFQADKFDWRRRSWRVS